MARVDNIVIEQIISIEWEMFQDVNVGGPRAECQDNRETFTGMRFGQFNAWPDAALTLYLEHLQRCVQQGRNLVMEKYIHMMRDSSPREYETLKAHLVFPDEEGVALADALCRDIVAQTERLWESCPHIARSARPLYSAEDSPAQISLETYQRGELYTYSNDVLQELTRHIQALSRAGRSFSHEILEHTVAYYGYKSIDAAEATAQQI